ncbi:MAG TPA: TIGR03790 family protein [Kiritimatiellia bacterium]|nr:TIGR03790 family protein [Kiritimatiellia bacterium]HRZ12557.1 TIGR03790 family protein [Kiritimatiellia bacterium]HSA17635.1 TIGR03790 family protein [Kiritimatiellia bacterium]
MRIRVSALLAAAAALLSPLPGRAGGGPQNVLVILNDQSIESQETGLYYRQLRGIPERNVLHVSVPPASAAAGFHDMTNTAFQTSIVDRISQHIGLYGLSNQIDTLVLCQDLPTRVSDNEGATAVLFYGFKNAPKIVASCSMPTNTASGYYKAERGFRHADKYAGTNYYLSFMLIGDRLSIAKSNVDVSVRSDGTRPGGCFYLVESSDAERNVRYPLNNNFDFHARFLSGFPAHEITGYGPLNQETNVLGFQWGSSQINDYWGATNRYLPGCMADHMTSFGARFPTDPYNQGKIWNWIRQGASASYGAVNEPCAYIEKFPDPLVFFWYARGFSLGESYWMSVANPYQGLFIGDPLAAPYADPPAVAVASLASNQVVSGTVAVDIQARTNAAGRPAARVDVFVDDLYAGTPTNVPPRPGNVLQVTISGQPVAYQVAAGDTLYSAVTSLAGRVNASNLAVRAAARGDRLELVYTNYGYFGTGVTYSAGTETGAAAELTVFAQALGSNLLESAYAAREFVQLQAYNGKANTGDTVTCVITLTNGVAATNRIIAAQNETPKQVVTRLVAAINSHAVLQGTNGAWANTHTYQEVSSFPLEARRPGPEGIRLHVAYTIVPAIPGSGLYPADSFSDFFNDNESDLTARGNVLFWCGRSPLDTSWAWDTTAWPNGPHTIRAAGRLGTGPEAQGHSVTPVLVSNSAFAARLLSPTNGEPFVLGSNVFLQAEVTNAPGVVTQVVFYVEDKPCSVLTNAPWVSAFDTADAGVGAVSVKALAWDSGGTRAVSPASWIAIQRSPTLDTDSDALPDSWEQQYFGGLYVYAATNDPDSDGMPNHFEQAHALNPTNNDAAADGDGDKAGNWQEYVAATDPGDSNSVFRVASGSDTNRRPLLSFFADTGRLYEVRYNSDYLTNFNGWLVASPAPFAGSGGLTNWLDDGSETEPPPEDVTQRLYRVRVALPD